MPNAEGTGEPLGLIAAIVSANVCCDVVLHLAPAVDRLTSYQRRFCCEVERYTAILARILRAVSQTTNEFCKGCKYGADTDRPHGAAPAQRAANLAADLGCPPGHL